MVSTVHLTSNWRMDPPASAATLPAAMNWLLRMTLVLVVALVVAAIHFAFMRWMTRQSAPAAVREPVEPRCTEKDR